MVRELLLRIDELHLPAGTAAFLSVTEEPLALPGDDPDSIAYHMRLLMDAGFIDSTKTDAFRAVGAEFFGRR
jgi:hypothetical protein